MTDTPVAPPLCPTDLVAMTVATRAATLAITTPSGTGCRRISVTRDLDAKVLPEVNDPAGLQAPAYVPIATSGDGDRRTNSWQDRLLVTITAEGRANGEWQGTTTRCLLRPLLDAPSTWRQIMAHLAILGISHVELIQTLAVTEARGWTNLSNAVPDEPLDLAAFLRDTGLLRDDQIATLTSTSPAFRECRFETLCKELVGQKLLSLATVAFLYRLGRLTRWHVVPPLAFPVAVPV